MHPVITSSGCYYCWPHIKFCFPFRYEKMEMGGTGSGQWCSSIKIIMGALAHNVAKNNSKSRNLPIYGINKGAQGAGFTLLGQGVMAPLNFLKNKKSFSAVFAVSR